MQWHYTKDGRQIGPIDEATFNKLVETGEIKPDTMVWNEDMEAGWAAYSTVAPEEPRLRVAKRDLARPDVGKALGRVAAGDLVKKSSGQDDGSSELKFAGFWRRAVAAFLDAIVKTLMAAAFGAIAVGLKLFVYKDAKGKKSELSDAYDSFPDALQFEQVADMLKDVALTQTEIYIAAGLSAVAFLSLFFYKPYWIGKKGGTPGKLMMKCCVVRSDLDPVTNGRAMGRYFAEALSGLILGIGYLMVMFDKEKRALHDHICDTRVVKKS